MKAPLLTLGSLLISSMALATPDLSIRGFGTLGAVHNFSDGAATIRDIGQPSGPRDDTSFDVDSRLGIQFDTSFAPNVSTSLQLLSRYDYEGKYTPQVSLAFLKYDFHDNYQFRLGRFGWDVYSMSDSRDIGYSYVWVRPPTSYFGKLQQDWVDGADFRFTHRLPKGLLSGKVYAGFSSENVAIDKNSYIDREGTYIVGGFLSYRYKAWMLRVSYANVDSKNKIHGDLVSELADMLGSGEQYSPDVSAASSIAKTKLEVEISSASIVYDNGPLQVQMMVSRDAYTNSPSDDETVRGFITTSYRIGEWTPFMTLAGTDVVGGADSDSEVLGVTSVLDDQYSISAGVRYDFRTNFALKLQADHFEVSEDGRNSILWRDVQGDWNGHINQLSLTLDFIF